MLCSVLTDSLLTLALFFFADLDAVDLDSTEWSSDINNVTGVLKLWLRELPDPLMTSALHQSFIDAASTLLVPSFLEVLDSEFSDAPTEVENDRLRHIRLHERVNDLPDPNYATLKYFMGHLHR